MEAADDISYCVADLEDAVEKRIFSVEQLYQHLYEARAFTKKALCLIKLSKTHGRNRVRILLAGVPKISFYVFTGEYAQ